MCSPARAGAPGPGVRSVRGGCRTMRRRTSGGDTPCDADEDGRASSGDGPATPVTSRARPGGSALEPPDAGHRRQRQLRVATVTQQRQPHACIGRAAGAARKKASPSCTTRQRWRPASRSDAAHNLGRRRPVGISRTPLRQKASQRVGHPVAARPLEGRARRRRGDHHPLDRGAAPPDSACATVRAWSHTAQRGGPAPRLSPTTTRAVLPGGDSPAR